jgi:hypothetical protein
LTCFGLIFLTAGIFSFRHIGAIDKTFETPFFMHRKKNRGRFQQIEVMVTDVMVHERNGKVAVSRSLRGQDPKSGSRLEWTTPPKSYTFNNVPFDQAAASQLRNKTLLLTYDPDNTSDYYFDIFQSGATRVA